MEDNSPENASPKNNSPEEAGDSPQKIDWLRWPATWVYVALSGLDILLTYQLLSRQGHTEANPLARFFIYSWGLKGMVWFKLGMTTFVLGLVHALLQKRESYARLVVRLGALIVGGVVVYSSWLLYRN